MKAWWQLYREGFAPDECRALINYAKTMPDKDGGIGFGDKFKLDPNMRRSRVRWLKRDDGRLLVFCARIRAMLEEVNRNAFNFDIQGLPESFQFTEYNADNSGHYDWHEDNSFKSEHAQDRKLSMVIQLSDAADYEGGKLELNRDPLPDGMFRNQGDVIFFPTFNRHRVTPVTRGVRYSLVCWFMGPHFR